MAEPVRVFVSHSHKDDEFTARLVTDLRAAGVDVWVDTADIKHDDFIKRINEGLRGRQWLILIMTPDSLQSEWVQMEVNAAINRTMQKLMRGVIPVLARNCDPDEIPPTWATLHRYDAMLNYDQALTGLLKLLSVPRPKGSLTCPECGTQNAEHSAYCHSCGLLLLLPASTPQNKHLADTRQPHGRSHLPTLASDTPITQANTQGALSLVGGPRLRISPLRADLGLLVIGECPIVTFAVENRGAGMLDGYVEANHTCLQLGSSTVNADTRAIHIRVDTTSLSPGPYVCHIAVRTTGGDQILPVRFTLRAPHR